MKKSLLAVLALILALGVASDAQRRRRGSGSRRAPASTTSQAGSGMVNEPCSPSITSIEECPDQGCGGSFDTFLNKQKNIRTSTETATDMTLQDLKDLTDPVPGFKKGDPRDPLTALGEGKMIRVIAYALVARKGSSETCNCHLTAPKDTDNHIVLVDPQSTIQPWPKTNQIQRRQSLRRVCD